MVDGQKEENVVFHLVYFHCVFIFLAVCGRVTLEHVVLLLWVWSASRWGLPRWCYMGMERGTMRGMAREREQAEVERERERVSERAELEKEKQRARERAAMKRERERARERAGGHAMGVGHGARVPPTDRVASLRRAGRDGPVTVSRARSPLCWHGDRTEDRYTPVRHSHRR